MLGQSPFGLLQFLSGTFNGGSQNILLLVAVALTSVGEFFFGHLQAHFGTRNGAFKFRLLLFRADLFGSGTGLGGGNNICSASPCGEADFSGEAAALALAFSAASRRAARLASLSFLGLFYALLMEFKALAGMV